MFALVHSPPVGPTTWRPVAAELRARGHPVVVPSLAAAFAGGTGPYYPRLAAAVADEIAHAGGERVVLVAHSGAGALLPAVTTATSAAVGAVVYVDALLPVPGHSVLDTLPDEIREQLRGLARDGRLPPWHEWFPPGTLDELLPDPQLRARFCAELPRLPLAYFEEPAPGPARTSPPGAYLQLSDAYAATAQRAERDGWPVVRRSAHHLAVLTEPADVATALEELAADVQG